MINLGTDFKYQIIVMGLTMSLIQDAKSGMIPEISQIADVEGVSAEKVRNHFISGRLVIPKNPIHNPKSVGIGKGVRIKINVNLGTSPDHIDLAEELSKAEIAMKYGTDTIMDLSIGGDIDQIRHEIIKNVNIPIGTVPIYQAGLEVAKTKNGAVIDMTEDQIFNAIEKHAKDGVDFMTVHAGLTSKAIERLKNQGRVADVVSRGGAFHLAWILHHEKENPLYSSFDRLLDIAYKYDVTLSLGDGLRPGAIADASDRPQIEELLTLGELVKRCWERDVQVMVEGPGHIKLDEILMHDNFKRHLVVLAQKPFHEAFFRF